MMESNIKFCKFLSALLLIDVALMTFCVAVSILIGEYADTFKCIIAGIISAAMFVAIRKLQAWYEDRGIEKMED